MSVKKKTSETSDSMAQETQFKGIDGKNVIGNKEQHKVINDPVHGTIKLHPLLIRIIDTPQFQRLRNMKQLGGASFVYPGACHTRFEHSIGVAHLAGVFVQALKTTANVEEKDVLCVQIAGLCHDLGRGPFSHVFDDMFIKKFFPHQTHEGTSVIMFDYLVEENGLKPLMNFYGLTDIDLTFIKEMMNPKEPYKGRKRDKHFLYEIVSNSTNSVDVVKFDYFARDCHYLGLQNSFDHRRYMEFARVCKADDGKTHICVRDKEVDNVYDIFHTRYRLHKRAYQHKVVKAVELMIEDAFSEAKDIIIEGTGTKLCDATTNMAAFTKLTDRVFEQILYSDSTDPNLKKAKDILERIMSRDLYKCLSEIKVPEDKIEQVKTKLDSPFEGDLEIKLTTLDYGWEEKDPIEHTWFYRKKNPTIAVRKPQEDTTLPKYMLEVFIRLFQKTIRRNEQITARENAKERFKEWCRENGFEPPDDDITTEEPCLNTKVLKMSISNK